MNNYSWIKPGVHAWVAGLALPVEVKILHIKQYRILVSCGIIEDVVNLPELHQTEAECLEAMKKEL